MNKVWKVIFLCIVERVHSFATIEEKDFRQLKSNTNLDFVAFSRLMAKRELLPMYVRGRDKVKDMLLKAPDRICLIADNWKSNHAY